MSSINKPAIEVILVKGRCCSNNSIQNPLIEIDLPQ